MFEGGFSNKQLNNQLPHRMLHALKTVVSLLLLLSSRKNDFSRRLKEGKITSQIARKVTAKLN